MAGIKMIIGLGNPGKAYEGTRHNIGFDVVDAVAARLDAAVRQKKFNSLLGEARYQDLRVLLLKPQQFMNLSGQAVAAAAGFYKLAAGDLMVIADDLALPAGQIRMRPGGGSGGHNGLRDIIGRLGSDQFARLRVGIGSPEFGDAADFVLSRPSAAQQAALDEAKKKAQEALLCWLANGLDAAMNRYNAKEAVSNGRKAITEHKPNNGSDPESEPTKPSM